MQQIPSHCHGEWEIDASGFSGANNASSSSSTQDIGLMPLHRIIGDGVATSTGSILLAAMAVPREETREPLGIEEVLQFYRQDAKEIFRSCSSRNCSRTFLCRAPDCVTAVFRWLCCCGCFGCCKNCWGVCGSRFEHEALERILEEKLGEVTFRDCLMDINFTAYDFYNNRPILFGPKTTPELLVRQGVRASTAAPTFFMPHTIEDYPYRDERLTSHLMDGALVEGFPLSSAYFLQLNNGENEDHVNEGEEAVNAPRNINQKFMLAIGTGITRKERAESFKYTGSLGMINPLIDILMSASDASAHRHVLEVHSGYFYLQGPIGRRLDVLGKPEKIPDLIKKGTEYVESSLGYVPASNGLTNEMSMGVREAIAHLPGGERYEQRFRAVMLEALQAKRQQELQELQEMQQELEELPPVSRLAWQEDLA